MSSNMVINRACGLMRLLPHTPVVVPSRALAPNLYAYAIKKKRMAREKSKSLDWAEPIFSLRKKEQEARDCRQSESPPHMLHVVCLIKQTRGRPWWEKEIVEKLGLEGKLFQPVIQKNIPSVNKLLNEVKHLVQIQPLTFPNGMPEDEADWEHTRINSRGEMIVIKRLKTFEPDDSVPADPESEKWKLDLDTLRKDLDKKCTDFNVHTEYKPAEYSWRRNQDGKMYRYNFNKDTPKYEW